MTLHRLLLAIAIAAIAARVAWAEDPALREAKLHFERGEKLYALTRFSEAIDEYQKAFDARPLPDFLFNIGQCYRNLGDYDSAIFSYRKYLTLAQDPPNRAQVEQLIRDLEAKRTASDTQRLGLKRPPPSTAPPPAAHPPEQASDRPIYGRWWFWTGIAVVAVAGGVTAYELSSDGPPSTSLGNIIFGK
ncbi:MAG TPA: tetratricopeptide repeat protein [Kofleriaceae bacterium]|nr:tetratricopeptide repeat protein [Kofleriaceae bacterium]